MNIDEKLKQDFILLGKHIRKLREEKSLTIKDVSLKTGIRVQYLQKIEKGFAYGVRLEKHLLKIAITLQVKMSELLNYK